MKTERGGAPRTASRGPAPQRTIFARSEGDRYFARNREEYGRPDDAGDALLDALVRTGSTPGSVLEVGSANAVRLARLRERFPGARCVGVDPSADALADARRRHPGIHAARATAEGLPFADDSFDWVLFGFCLYLCDRDDLFRIAAEADRVLAPTGVVGIVDFVTDEPHSTPYAHHEGAFSYKMDHAAMFTWNPVYRCVHRASFPYDGSGDRLGVTLLERRPASAFPVRRRP